MKNFINENEDKVGGILVQLGDIIKKLHGVGIIHGDLTTSNMIYKDG